MRIVSVCRVFPTQRLGGMGHVCSDRAEALVRSGHEVHVLTTGKKGVNGPQEINGVTVHHLPCAPEEYSTQFAQEAARACERLAPEILHLDSLDMNRPWWKTRPGKPRRIAATMHGFELGAFLTQWNLFRTSRIKTCPDFPAQTLKNHCDILERTLDVVIAISHHEHWMLADCYALPNVAAVANPIPLYFFDKPQVPPPPQARRFLCAAVSGQRERGFDIAEACAKRIGAELVVVSNKKREEMPELYDSVSAVLIPTFYSQGFDLTVAEAMARGRPVIASRTGSYWRAHEDGCPGLIMVRAADKDGLCAAMSGDLPEVQKWASRCFHPAEHVREWLKAVEHRGVECPR